MVNIWDDDNKWVPELCVEDHGGGCCGIRHLSEFDLDPDDLGRRPTFDDKLQFIKNGVTEAIDDHGSSQLAIEAVLSRDQWKGWERALQRSGFRRVLEFLNSNSGNRCRIYYLATNQPPKPKKNTP